MEMKTNKVRTIKLNKSKAKVLDKLKKVIRIRDAYKSTSPNRNQTNNKLPILKHGISSEASNNSMNKDNNMRYIEELGIFHEGNYDDMSHMYKKRKVSLQNIFGLPPSPRRIALSKRTHNYSVETNNNIIKSRVSFFPAANTTTNHSLKSKLEMINKNEGNYSRMNSIIVRDPKGDEGKLDLNSPISTIKNMRNIENKNTLKSLTKKYEYRMFLEDHIYENLITTIDLLKHQEDMGIVSNPHRFYKYQRDALDEQRILAEEIRRDYISGRSDPSLKTEMVEH